MPHSGRETSAPTRVRKTELAALGLVHHRPMHGYRLSKAIRLMQLEQWTMLSRSSIYAALRRLAADGAVSVTQEREGRAPERTVYHITDAGRRLLAEIVAEALGYIGPEDRYFYLGLAFLEALPQEETLRILEERARRLAGEIEEAQRTLDAPPWPSAWEHFAISHRGGMEHARTEIAICREVISFLQAQPDYVARLGGHRHDR